MRSFSRVIRNGSLNCMLIIRGGWKGKGFDIPCDAMMSSALPLTQSFVGDVAVKACDWKVLRYSEHRRQEPQPRFDTARRFVLAGTMPKRRQREGISTRTTCDDDSLDDISLLPSHCPHSLITLSHASHASFLPSLCIQYERATGLVPPWKVTDPETWNDSTIDSIYSYQPCSRPSLLSPQPPQTDRQYPPQTAIQQ